MVLGNILDPPIIDGGWFTGISVSSGVNFVGLL